MNLEEIGINAGNWVDSAQDRNYWRALLNAALNLRVPEAMELSSQLIIIVKCAACQQVYGLLEDNLYFSLMLN